MCELDEVTPCATCGGVGTDYDFDPDLRRYVNYVPGKWRTLLTDCLFCDGTGREQ